MRWVYTRTIEHLLLFNKIFNSKKAIKREAQIVATILLYNCYYFNNSFKTFIIKYTFLENNFEIKKYLIAYKTQDSKLIVLSKYTLSEIATTINFILLKDVSHKYPLNI